MKKCAVCHGEYDDAYDACPACAKRSLARRQLAIWSLVGVLAIAGVVAYTVTKPQPAIVPAEQVQAALDTQPFAAVVKDVAVSGASVRVATFLSGTDRSRGSEIAAYIARIWPTVQQVTVIDGDGAEIGTYARQ